MIFSNGWDHFKVSAEATWPLNHRLHGQLCSIPSHVPMSVHGPIWEFVIGCTHGLTNACCLKMRSYKVLDFIPFHYLSRSTVSEWHTTNEVFIIRSLSVFDLNEKDV